MKRLTVILLTSIGLAGCVNMSAPPQQATGSFQTQAVAQRQQQLNAIQSWHASGAISLQRAGQSPIIMRYDWRQMGQYNYHVDLAASLNLAAVSMTGQPNRVTLQKGDEPPVTAATPEQLMQKNLGWGLPIPELWYWARGLPAPGANQGIQYDKYGHLVMLRQGGWQVRFSGYHTVKNVDLPGVMDLQRADITVRVVIKEWQILPKSS